jgi:hypothetical protein
MNISEFQSKHCILHRNLIIRSRLNKALFLFLLFLAMPAVYFEASTATENGKLMFDGLESIIFTGVIYVLLSILLILGNPLTFVGSSKVAKFKHGFKTDLFKILQERIPEFQVYHFRQKLHPALFVKSGLFKTDFEDYDGDDLIYGCYKGVKFAICELIISKLFKKIFEGVFIHFKITNPFEKGLENFSDHPNVQEFSAKYNAKLSCSINFSEIFIAIRLKGEHLESGKKRQNNNTEADIELFEDINRLIKTAIDKTLVS